MHLVSVHIVTHNNAKTLPKCLEGVRKQRCTDYQIAVFDNNSADDSAQIAEDAGVTLFKSSENIGYAQAHNRLIDLTDSTYVLTLNPDVYLLPNFLAALVEQLEKNPAAGSAAGCLLRVDQLGDEPKVIDSTGLSMHRNRHQYLLNELTPLAGYAPSPRPIFGPDGAAAFYRRDMLEDIRVMGEVFDNHFFMQKEDVDICWRAQLRGWSSLHVPEAVAHHIRTFRPKERWRASAQMRLLGIRNRYLLMLKNDIGAHFLRDLPRIVIYDMALLAYLLLFEWKSLPAFWSLWKLRKHFLQKRKIVQSRRNVEWQEIARSFEI
jgi:GT2 family glycosyltransferase